MSLVTLRYRTLPLFCCAALALPAAPARAGLPNNLSDIPYQSYEWGSEQLRYRGYSRMYTSTRNGRDVEYWWNGTSNSCVQAVAEGGKVSSLKTTSATDCNQYHKQATDNDMAAAVAVAAAAAIGVAALAHKSHERDDRHDKDARSVAEFDRGYRDGLYHQAYHNYNRTDAYSDGYNAGQEARHEETHSYRGNHGRYSGYHPYVAVNDLVGTRASSADSELRSRGFNDVGGYKEGGKSHVTWYNRGTHQCVEAITKDGEIRRLNDIDEGNCL